jgi:HSP20 family protein
MRIKNDRRVRTPFSDLHIDVDDLVGHFFGDRHPDATAFVPPVSISEDDSSYAVTVELPGVRGEDVNLEMTEGLLQITGQKAIEEPSEGTVSLREERQQGNFKRVFEFAKAVDTERIEAVFENGLLQVTLPKSEKILPRKIEIKTQ